MSMPAEIYRLTLQAAECVFPMEIILPERINAAGLLPFLGALGQVAPANAEIEVNFSVLRRVSPAALAALTATVTRWQREHGKVSFCGIEQCAITGYLQRMDVFSNCGIAMPENFTRHESKGRFVPVQQIDWAVDTMGHAMSACVAPGGEDYGHPLSALYDFVWYVLTETANNVHQHSGGKGYATAQLISNEGLVRLAIADNGRGILKSFRDAGFPWAMDLDDAAAIKKALEPLVSSRGTPTNEGVGLTLTTELARLARAWLLIVSGRGLVRISPDGITESGTLPEGGNYPGTLVALTFRRSGINNFAELLTEAKVRSGLLPKPGQLGIFKP